MSRVAKSPVVIPAGIEVSLNGNDITVKGKSASLSTKINSLVKVAVNDGAITFAPVDDSLEANAQSGTARANIANMVKGVEKGFERKLTLIGVGYRAQAKGKVLNLELGYSHPINYEVPEGITIETPSQTEIVVKGVDKALVGQVAANLRAYRKPEPYKGKGVRYADEVVHIKEVKKK